jgi:hypothetical protein
MRRALLCLGLALCTASCAGQECDFHSECGRGRYCSFGGCEQDCREDFDCDATEVCNEIGQCVSADGAVPRRDGGMGDAGRLPDAGMPGDDAGRPIDAGMRDAGRPMDAGMRDAGPIVGTGGYLDRCEDDGDCASGHCVDDVGGVRTCSITCAAHRDCAVEHVCADGVCVPDDTGAPCSAGSSCELELCLGNVVTGAAQCTRECNDARDCPAGFACTSLSGLRLCVNIEIPCDEPNDCPTGLCLGALGCSAECRSVSDCPARFDFAAAYFCQRVTGYPNTVCAPPVVETFGSDPLGASCRTNTSGDYLCRSSACNVDAPGGPMCIQTCTEEGGCPAGFGCAPISDGTDVFLSCARAGNGALGEPCASDLDCASALCGLDGFCTRFCTDDGVCPSGLRCEAVPGLGVSVCGL